MLPIYSMVVDILDMKGSIISEEQFREQVSQCLGYLEALSVSVARKPGNTTFYPPPSEPDRFGCVSWSVRFVAINSLGRVRADGLAHAFYAIVRLIEIELPHLKVHYEMGNFDFA